MSYDNVFGEQAFALSLPSKQMDSILHDLGGILLNGLPTFFLILLLNFYLKAVFFKPLEATLAKRYAMTDGARKAAITALAAADARIAEHQSALRAARAELYKEQETLNREFEERQTTSLKAAHAESENGVRFAKIEINAEVETATRELAGQSDALAEEIATSILRGKAA